MAKTVKEIEKMNMNEVKRAIDTNVEAFNNSKDFAERTELKLEAKKLETHQNLLAKLDVYANALKAEMPLAHIVKLHHYEVVKMTYKMVDDTENGKAIIRETASIDDANKNVDMFDFIEWAEGRSKKVTAESAWKAIIKGQRSELIKVFKKAAESSKTFTVSKTTANNVLQAVFDALVFIPGASGKNSVFPSNDAKNIIIACAADYRERINDTNGVDVSLHFLSDKKWKSLVQSALYLVLSKKNLVYLYADEPTAKAEDKPKEDKSKAK